MKIKFDYNNVSPEDVKAVLEEFYKSKEKALGTDNEPVEMGKINLYISYHNKTDNESLITVDDDGDIVSWLVKNRVMKRSKKEILLNIEDDENNRKVIIYKDKDKPNKNWSY